MVDKLTGQQYIDHWTTRMARGPLEAGTPENAEDTWLFIRDFVAELNPANILEYGCAYGRMLRRIQSQWPKARLFGVDLSKEALDHLKAHWQGRPPTVYNQSSPPLNIRVDMIFTCTVLQHVTDRDVLNKIAEGFRTILNPGGHLVLFENITWGKGKGGAHMTELTAQEYMDLWPELQWEDCGTFMHGLEAHELLIGTKPATTE